MPTFRLAARPGMPLARPPTMTLSNTVACLVLLAAGRSSVRRWQVRSRRCAPRVYT